MWWRKLIATLLSKSIKPPGILRKKQTTGRSTWTSWSQLWTNMKKNCNTREKWWTRADSLSANTTPTNSGTLRNTTCSKEEDSARIDAIILCIFYFSESMVKSYISNHIEEFTDSTNKFRTRIHCFTHSPIRLQDSARFLWLWLFFVVNLIPFGHLLGKHSWRGRAAGLLIYLSPHPLLPVPTG